MIVAAVLRGGIMKLNSMYTSHHPRPVPFSTLFTFMELASGVSFKGDEQERVKKILTRVSLTVKLNARLC